MSNWKRFPERQAATQFFVKHFNMTNQSFCYWLQGYFEIALSPLLTKKKIQLIEVQLNMVKEPLGVFTQWLRDVISFLGKQNYPQSMFDMFLIQMKKRLNLVFYHIIDLSYERKISLQDAKRIHDGELSYDK